MNDFLNCYDRNRKKIAILQNAWNIEELQELNQIYYTTFKIPGDDPKLEYLQPFNYIRWNEDGQLYRIVKRSVEEADTETVTVVCEHVVTMLCNDILYGTFNYGGGTVKTADVMKWLLSKQRTKNWEFGGCDFDRRFEYTWKYENILSALFSLPKEFGESYMWDYKTTVYPWQLYLRKLDNTINPEFYIRANRNLVGSTDDKDYTGIYTRIYALGYEENDTFLDITSVNDGIPYVEADPEYIEKYGLIEAILIDRRFENVDSLKAYAESVLKASLEPAVSRTFDVVDLYPLTNSDIDNAHVGALTRLTGDGSTFFITKTTRILDEPGNLSLELSTRSVTIADYMAGLAERVRIDSVY